jgi:aminoglycoside phosphotransferase (APT) family kinase protein
MIDAAAPVRPGEELPVEQLTAYLKQQLPESNGSVNVQQFPHGHSNLTYLVTIGEQEFVLRRAPAGNQVRGAHDMSREYRVLDKLCHVYPPAPRPLLFCGDEAVLGTPFYLMERRHGIVIRKSLPAGLTIDAATARKLSTALVDNLANLHAVDYQAAGLGDLGKPAGYVERQVTGWADRYAKSQTEDVPAMARLDTWLATHMPAGAGSALIHNDFKYDNLLLDARDLTHIVAVLDWEMATIGDPLMDLGTTLAYWVEAGDPEPLIKTASAPTYLPGSLSRRELVERYAERTGRNIADPVFYYCFGLYKIAVIIQQIYARYVRGHTNDARFARLIDIVRILADQADRTVLAGKMT